MVLQRHKKIVKVSEPKQSVSMASLLSANERHWLVGVKKRITK